LLGAASSRATAALRCGPGRGHPAVLLELGVGDAALLQRRRGCCPEGER